MQFQMIATISFNEEEPRALMVVSFQLLLDSQPRGNCHPFFLCESGRGGSVKVSLPATGPGLFPRILPLQYMHTYICTVGSFKVQGHEGCYWTTDYYMQSHTGEKKYYYSFFVARHIHMYMYTHIHCAKCH